MPSHFTIQFDLAVSEMGPLPALPNILQIVSSSGRPLISVSLLNTDNLRVAYDSITVTSTALSLATTQSAAYTTITTSYADGNVTIRAADSATEAAASFFDTTGLTFHLLLSGDDAVVGQRASIGLIKNITITGTTVCTATPLRSAALR
jgi:hypothetical protein